MLFDKIREILDIASYNASRMVVRRPNLVDNPVDALVGSEFFWNIGDLSVLALRPEIER